MTTFFNAFHSVPIKLGIIYARGRNYRPSA